MLDQAGIRMAQGAEIACERISGVNDNMYQPHYHNYYELYYLEEGGRYQRSGNDLYLLQPGDFMLFSPYCMHYSYGDLDMRFRRIILYFQREEIDSPELIRILDEGSGVFRPDAREERRKPFYQRMPAQPFKLPFVPSCAGKEDDESSKNRTK